MHRDAARQLFGEPESSPAPKLDKNLALLAFTNRSGSSLLGERMHDSGAFTRTGEPLNAENLKKRCIEREISKFSDYIVDLYRGHRPTLG